MTCKPHSVRQAKPAWMTIYLSGPPEAASSRWPGEQPVETKPLFDLAPERGCPANALLRFRWSLTPPFHPYPLGRYVSVALSDRFPRPGISPVSCSLEYGLSSTCLACRDHPVNPVNFHDTQFSLNRQLRKSKMIIGSIHYQCFQVLMFNQVL